MQLPPQTLTAQTFQEKKIMSTLTRAAAYTVRIAALTAAAPVRGRGGRFSRDREAGRLGTAAARQLTAVRRGYAA